MFWSKKKSIIEQIREREAKEKEWDDIPVVGRRSPEQSAEIETKRMESANAKDLEEPRKKREKEEKTEDNLKLVIDTAKLECKLCSNPKGLMKVNYDTPTIQEKKTATVKEKSPQSLVFMGTCSKSPQSSSPCASVMQLGEWKDIGTSKSQDELVLLQKSTIKCNYGSIDVKITDSGQVNVPESITTTAEPVPTSVTILKKFILHFRRPSSYNGEFGFDWLRDEYIYPIVSVGSIPPATPPPPKELSLDPAKLKIEYKTTDVSDPKTIHTKDYYCSFLNLMLNQEATLDLEVEELEALSTDATEIVFESSNPDLTITPASIPLNTLIAGGKKNKSLGGTDIRDYYLAANQVKVKCNKAFTKNEQIKVIAKLKDPATGVENKQEVGKMMVMKNSDQAKYTIIVYVIKSYLKNDLTFGLSTIDSKISNVGGLQAIEDYLNKNSLNQGLIQVKLIPLIDWVFTKQTLVNTSNTPNTDYTGMIVNQATMLMDDGKYMNFINNQFKKGYPTDAGKKGLFIYLTPFLSPSAGGASYNIPLTSKHIILFKDNLDHLSSYSHEIGHSLGLEHTFKEGQTVQQKITNAQNKLTREENAKATRLSTYAVYYSTHSQEKAKDVAIYDQNIKSYKDELNVLKKNIHKFEDKTTENIMDYDLTNQKTFFKWQWKVIEEETKAYYH